MRALARSVIVASLFLDVSDDDVIDPDSAVSALENIACELSSTDDDEKLALREAVDEMIAEEQARPSGLPPRPEVLAFYQSFMEYVGLNPRE